MFLAVGSNRFGVAVIKLGLKAFDLLDAEFVHLGVYLHVLLLRHEDIFRVPCREVVLEGNQRLLPQVFPLSCEHLVVVNDNVICGVSWHSSLPHRRELLLLLRHYAD